MSKSYESANEEDMLQLISRENIYVACHFLLCALSMCREMQQHFCSHNLTFRTNRRIGRILLVNDFHKLNLNVK